MAKLAFLAAVMALSLFLATASFRTTVTIDEEEAENPRGQSCQQQMQQQGMLRHCQMYMQEQRQRRFDGGDNMDNQEEHRQMCCDQLRQMDTQCRCPAIRRMVESEMGSAGREMMEMAQNLPSMCRLQPQRCQFGNDGEAIVA